MPSYEAIDHLIVRTRDLDEASAFERLGLRLTPRMRHGDLGTENRAMFVGRDANLFYVELLAMAASTPFPDAAVVLRVSGLRDALRELAGHGIVAEPFAVPDGDGNKICDIAMLDVVDRAATAVAVVEYANPGTFAPPLDHAFPLERLDHLAAMAPNLEAATSFWTAVLGVPVFGEVVTPGFIVRQLKIGDAILELLGPPSAESPLAQRPPGLVSMAAFEVKDLAGAVASARAAGFTAPDPRPGGLPGSRTSTIPAQELCGLGLQLISWE